MTPNKRHQGSRLSDNRINPADKQIEAMHILTTWLKRTISAQQDNEAVLILKSFLSDTSNIACISIKCADSLILSNGKPNEMSQLYASLYQQALIQFADISNEVNKTLQSWLTTPGASSLGFLFKSKPLKEDEPQQLHFCLGNDAIDSYKLMITHPDDIIEFKFD